MLTSESLSLEDPISVALDEVNQLLESGSIEEALSRLDGMLALTTDEPRIYRLLSYVLQEAKRFDEAILAQQYALLLNAGSWQDLLRLGEAYMAAHDIFEAERLLRSAIKLAPQEAAPYLALSMVLADQGKLNEALSAAGSAQQMAPVNWKCYLILAQCYKNFHQVDMALIALERGLQLEPCEPRLHAVRSIVRLSAFDLQGGWLEYQWRFYWKGWENPLRHSHLQPWNGIASDRPLLIWREQGIGDEIFHLGFIHQLLDRGFQLILEVDPRLVLICQRSFQNVKVIPSHSETLVSCQVYSVPMASIGMHLGASLEVAQARKTTYLNADRLAVAHFRSELKGLGNNFNIGISWMSTRALLGLFKCINLNDFLQLSNLPSVRLVNLQYGETAEQINLFNQQSNKSIIDFEFDKKNKIDQLLSLIDACDLIVTISNVTAHLACALGKECLVILPAGGTLLWYWHLNGSSSPWYRNAVLFRQQKIGIWENIVQEVIVRTEEIILKKIKC